MIYTDPEIIGVPIHSAALLKLERHPDEIGISEIQKDYLKEKI
jgi:hypothetical protein